MTDEQRVLVRVLAASDALRLPIRSWAGGASANRTSALESLASLGVPLRTGGSDVAERKSAERLITGMARNGLLLVARVGRAKFPHLRLTAGAEADARALCGLPGRPDGRAALAAVAAGTDREPKTLDRLWLPEVALNDGRGWGDSTPEERNALADVELNFLPAASAGWLVAHSDCAGRAHYAVTAAGWSELDAPTADEPSAVPFLPGAADLYRAEQDAQLAALVASKPERAGEIGAPPLPVSMHGVRLSSVAARSA